MAPRNTARLTKAMKGGCEGKIFIEGVNIVDDTDISLVEGLMQRCFLLRNQTVKCL